MSYAKAMKHASNPRKWKRTRVKDGRGMSAAGKRGNALVFGELLTEPRSAKEENQMNATGILAEQYGCPSDINFRFWLFVLATSAEAWESNVDYMRWIQGMKYREGSEAAGAVLEDNGNGFSSADQVDAYMAAGIPVPTPEQIAQAHRYFASMPSRQDKQ